MEWISVPLDAKGRLPLYMQLHDHIAAEITGGRLPAGERLPGKRTAAKLLGVSLSTVDSAYQLLASEGFIASRPRSGFVVCKLEQLEPVTHEEPVFSESSAEPAVHYDREICSLLTGGVDAGLFPFRTWAQLFKDTLYNRPDLLAHGDPRGDADLRQAIAQYLYQARGVNAPHDRIIIGAGMEYLLWLLCHLLKGKRAAVEQPGYPKVYQILSRGGIDTCFIPLDGQGMEGAALRASDADFAYVTPGHQFPTGLVMPAGRRTELLKWASEKEGRYIIEDDYDSEFRFDGRPMPCMQTLDPQRVIYIGTFSRTIAPAIRVAYMVLPRALMEEYRKSFSFFSCTVSRFEQQTLCRYIGEGHFGRSLNRMRSQYRGRRDVLLTELIKTFGNHIVADNTHTGLSFLLRLDCDRTEEEIEARAWTEGVHVRGLRSYGGPKTEKPTLVVGFGSLEPEQIPEAVRRLYRAVMGREGEEDAC